MASEKNRYTRGTWSYQRLFFEDKSSAGVDTQATVSMDRSWKRDRQAAQNCIWIYIHQTTLSDLVLLSPTYFHVKFPNQFQAAMTTCQRSFTRQLYDAADINSRKRKWTVLVQVVERRRPMTSIANPTTRYRTYLLTDMTGTKISAVTYSSNIEYFRNTLAPFKRYYISNAGVRPIGPAFQVSEYTFAWTFYNTTLVEPFPEAIPPPLPCTFDVTPFSELFRHADLDRPVNIKALVVHTYPSIEHSETISTKDIVVINKEKRPILLKIWRDIEEDDEIDLTSTLQEPTLIIAMSMRVTTFHGLSLSTRANSYFLKNPPLQSEDLLTQWYTDNLEDVTSLLEKKAHRDISILLPPPDPEDVIQVTEALTSLEQTKTAWVGGKFTLIPNQAKFCYTACINCNKSLNADSTWSINCPACKEETVVYLRSNLGVHFMDNASSLEATIYSPDVEKLIPYTTETLQEADDTQDTLVQNNIAAALLNKNVVCYMKYYDRMVKGEMVRKYPILKVYTHAEVYGETSEPTQELPNTNPPEQGNPVSPQSSNTETNLKPLQHEPTPFRSTPITITENISAAATKTTISTNLSHTKRTLQFTEIGVSKEKDPSVSNITTRMSMESEAPPSASTASESPIKKNKNKVKQA